MKTTLKVALVQSEVVWQEPETNRNNFEKLLQDLDSDTDLIVLPEMFTTGFTMQPEQLPSDEGNVTKAWMQRIANEKKSAITGSVPFLEQGSYRNRLFFMTSEGDAYHYDKRHTFTLAGEDKVYRSGTERPIISYRGFRICPMICYDLRFPVWARNTDNYDVLLYVANWPKPRITAWDTLLKARAIENMAYCIGVNRVGSDASQLEYPGHSAVYDGLGAPLVHQKENGVFYATLQKEHVMNIREKLRFLNDRDEFSLKV